MPFYGMRNLASEYDYRDGVREEDKRFEKSKAEVLCSYREKISIGQPMDGISELGSLDRQLLQASEFFPAGKAILRKVEEEEDTLFLDTEWIPSTIKDSLFLMDLEGMNKEPLLSVLRVARKDPDALLWLAVEENLCLWDESGVLEDAFLSVEEEFDTVNDGFYEDDEFLDDEFLRKPKHNFRPPRDRYKLADRHRVNYNSEACERRNYDLKGDIENLQELVSVESIESYLQLLRKDYEEDSILWREWSPSRKEDDRALYLQSMRAQKLDMETIRAKLWACFDRNPERIPVKQEKKAPLKAGWYEHFDESTGDIEEGYEMTPSEIAELEKRLQRDPSITCTQFRTVLPCIWEIERGRALRNLHHTKAQWKKVYQKAWETLEQALIGRARVANTSDKRTFIRRKSAQWQLRLRNEARLEIARILSEKEFEEVKKRGA